MPSSWYSIKQKNKAGSKKRTAEIAIYDEIGFFGVTAASFRDDLNALGEVEEIELCINSPGGDVLEGWAVYNLLNSHAAHIVARVDGLAASMASVILLAADEIRMFENSFIMIHRVSGGVYGDADDIADYAALTQKIEDGIVSAYIKRSGLEEEDIRSMMKIETYLTGTEAKEKGFCDVVLDGPKVAACAVGWKRHFSAAPSGMFDKQKGAKPQNKKSSSTRMTKKQRAAAAFFNRCKKASAKSEAALKEAETLLSKAGLKAEDVEEEDPENEGEDDGDDDPENEGEDDGDDDPENEGEDDGDDDPENESEDDEPSNRQNRKPKNRGKLPNFLAMMKRLDSIEAENKDLKNQIAKIKKGVKPAASNGGKPTAAGGGQGGDEKPDITKRSARELIGSGIKASQKSSN